MRPELRERIRRSNAAAKAAGEMGASVYEGTVYVQSDASPHSVRVPLCGLLDPDMPGKVLRHMGMLRAEVDE